MELNFIESEQMFSGHRAYECEFEVTADFNLHVERDRGGRLLLYQRTDGGRYDLVHDFGYHDSDPVVDMDCTALVYPKTMKIASEWLPTYAAVTSDGEVTEIKSQVKEVTVTENGTVEVTPDAGYSYLKSVTVKTDVPVEGGAIEILDLMLFTSGTPDYIEETVNVRTLDVDEDGVYSLPVTDSRTYFISTYFYVEKSKDNITYEQLNTRDGMSLNNTLRDIRVPNLMSDGYVYLKLHYGGQTRHIVKLVSAT